MNVVRDRMTLGQSTNGGLLSFSDITSSPLFVAGLTIIGVTALMSLGESASSASRRLKRSSQRRARAKARISAAKEELKAARREGGFFS